MKTNCWKTERDLKSSFRTDFEGESVDSMAIEFIEKSVHTFLNNFSVAQLEKSEFKGEV